MKNFEAERREFVRVNVDVPIRYKFLSTDPFRKFNTIFDGKTNNISGGGLLLVGKVPDFKMITELLMQKVVIGINVILPSSPEPIKALARVAWIEAIDESTQECAMGLKFKEITKEHQDKIFQFVIRSQLF